MTAYVEAERDVAMIELSTAERVGELYDLIAKGEPSRAMSCRMRRWLEPGYWRVSAVVHPVTHKQFCVSCYQLLFPTGDIEEMAACIARSAEREMGTVT